MDPGGIVDSRAFNYPTVPYLWQIILTIVNWLQPVLTLFKPTIRRAADAAQDLVDLSVAPQFAGQEGHFEMRRKVDSSPASHDEGMQALLWCKSLEWSGISQEDTVLPLNGV
jgi:hypothetical protein